jgi:predicted aspartyl protease
MKPRVDFGMNRGAFDAIASPVAQQKHPYYTVSLSTVSMKPQPQNFWSIRPLFATTASASPRLTILTTAIPLAGGMAMLTLLLATGAIAQERDGCIVNLPGANANLNKLCGSGPSSGSTGSGAGSVGSGRGGAANKSVFRAPIKRLSGKAPVIEVTFNGTRKFEMIVDTGADSTLITKAMATALRLPIVGTERFGLADGSVVSMPIGRLASMSVDGAVLRNVEVAIADDMDAGLLGHDFFGNYDVQIKRDVVEFRKRS